MSAADFAAAFASAVRYSRDHHDVNALAAGLPFAATRASDNGVLHPHRAALADALAEAGRQDEFAIAADPAKHLRLHHDSEDGWRVSESPSRWAPPNSSLRNGLDGATISVWSREHASPAVRQYLETALRASTGDMDEGYEGYVEGLDPTYPLDEIHHPQDFTDEAVDRAHHDIEKFKSKLSPEAREEADALDATDIGHNLWLSRNGHGTGFWDRDYEHGDEMHDAAKSLGEQYVEVEPLPNGDATDADSYRLHLHGGRE